MFAGAGTRPGRRSERAEKGLKFYGSWRAFLKALGLREVLSANRTYYVGYNLGSVAISIATPGVVTKTAHGLVADSRVSFSILPNTKTATVSIATPAVVTMANSFAAGQPIKFATAGALPTGITAGTTYYVIAAGLSGASFQFSATVGGAAVNTSGTQSGTHYVSETGALPTGVTAGQDYYVLATGLTANTFQFSATSGGAAINTSGTTSGTISAKTGSDSNDGLSNAIGGAFLTIQKAIDVAATLDLSIYDVDIQVGAGTFAEFGAYGPFVGAGAVTVVGDTVTPANVTVGTVTVSGAGSKLSINGLRTSGLTAQNGGYLQVIGNVTFYTSGTAICMTANGSSANIDALLATSLTVEAGTYGRFAYAIITGYVQLYAASVTFVGTPAWSSACADGQRLGFINAGTATLSGAATGKRFNSADGGVVNTAGGGANFFPGNVAGTGTDFGVSPYGRYI